MRKYRTRSLPAFVQIDDVIRALPVASSTSISRATDSPASEILKSMPIDAAIDHLYERYAAKPEEGSWDNR